jgi:hypothetical protein
MKKGRRGLTILACSVILFWAIADQALAAQKKPKEQVPAVASAHPSKPSPEPTQKSASPQGKKAAAPVLSDRQPEVLQRQVKQMPSVSKATGRKGHRQVKVSKQITPKALVQPRTDLAYHGMLEDSQRYDPRPPSRTAGVPNPQTPDLTHDHFQELDRNQDGKIDPVERAFGRLDMDRDLGDRQFR